MAVDAQSQQPHSQRRSELKVKRAPRILRPHPEGTSNFKDQMTHTLLVIYSILVYS